eukprot:Skav223500  [mRNA]  locus=scaffold1160:93056:96571:- [translate_table: standard]
MSREAHRSAEPDEESFPVDDESPLLETFRQGQPLQWAWRLPMAVVAASAVVLLYVALSSASSGGLSQSVSQEHPSEEWMMDWGGASNPEDEVRFDPGMDGPSDSQGGYGDDRYSDDRYGGEDHMPREDGSDGGDGGDGDGMEEDGLRTPHLDEASQELVDAAIDAASDKGSASTMSAADQAAYAGAEAAKEAHRQGFSKEASGKLASIAASKAGFAAGMPLEAAKTAGMLASQALTVDPTPPPKPIPPRIDCRDAVDVYEEECMKDVKWIKATGVVQHPDWYPGLTSESPLGDIQTAAMKSGHSNCNLQGCGGQKMECLPDGFGCLDEAVSYYKQWIAKHPAEGPGAAACKEPQMRVDGHCLCPPNMLPEGAQQCKMPKGPVSMTFYMYRAQSDYCYDMENVNLGDLAGVMWYLHKEVVASVPRKYNVTRILRYLVTVKNPQETFNHEQYLFNGETNGKQFGPFGAFDNARCTASHCEEELSEFGNAVGCQAVETMQYNYKRQAPVDYCEPADSAECVSGTWYSLVGACPLHSLYQKSDECKQQNPSPRCKEPDGTPGCNYAVRYAGQVSLDEVEGIPNYEMWWQNGTAPTGNIEYEVLSDTGNGTSFWNDRLSERQCSDRMQQVLGLFAKRYPSLPKDLPDPPCA